MNKEQEGIIYSILRITDIAQEPHDFLLLISGYEYMPLVSLEVAVEKLIDLIPDVKNYVHVARQRYEHSIDGLTQDESAAIMLYTMGWEPHDQCLYFVLNATLRSSDRQQLEPWYLYLRLLLNGLFRLPNISAIVYRCINLDLSSKYILGKTITWWGFSSCTMTLNTLQSEQYFSQTGPRTLFIIQCHSGKDIRKHSYFSSTDELLLLAGTSYQVTDYLHQGDLHIIYLKEIRLIYPLLQPIHLPIMSKLNNSYPSVSRNSNILLKTTSAPIFQSTDTIPLPVQFRNPRLEKIIQAKQSKSELSLISMELIDQDMEIVAFYISQDDIVTSLNLENNRIGNGGVRYLSVALLNCCIP
ncbi:unnamed protein product [Adineta steineri]|uniref:NAD(P)(+)--arginine ADP-ribosyltransferase n=2 Tax=Adineta steineri TaxID=433720 RepID=A0A815QKS9_9BILA|nr:unnamed protein product [Adineta steineri]